MVLDDIDYFEEALSDVYEVTFQRLVFEQAEKS